MKNIINFSRFECIIGHNVLKIYGEYSEFTLSLKEINAFVEGVPIKLSRDKIIKVTDNIFNKTSFCQADYVFYYLDSINIYVEDYKPLPVRVVVDVPDGQSKYIVNIEDLLKKQIDLKSNNFSILEIVDSKGGKAELVDDKVIFTPQENNKELMTFSFQFENEFGNSPSDSVPVLLKTPNLPADPKIFNYICFLT